MNRWVKINWNTISKFYFCVRPAWPVCSSLQKKAYSRTPSWTTLYQGIFFGQNVKNLEHCVGAVQWRQDDIHGSRSLLVVTFFKTRHICLLVLFSFYGTNVTFPPLPSIFCTAAIWRKMFSKIDVHTKPKSIENYCRFCRRTYINIIVQ